MLRLFPSSQLSPQKRITTPPSSCKAPPPGTWCVAATQTAALGETPVRKFCPAARAKAVRGLTLTPRPVLTLSGRPFHGGLFRAQERAVRQQRTPRLGLYPHLICLNSARDGSVVHEVALELKRTGRASYVSYEASGLYEDAGRMGSVSVPRPIVMACCVKMRGNRFPSVHEARLYPTASVEIQSTPSVVFVRRRRIKRARIMSGRRCWERYPDRQAAG